MLYESTGQFISLENASSPIRQRNVSHRCLGFVLFLCFIQVGKMSRERGDGSSFIQNRLRLDIFGMLTRLHVLYICLLYYYRFINYNTFVRNASNCKCCNQPANSFIINISALIIEGGNHHRTVQHPVRSDFIGTPVTGTKITTTITTS